MEPALVVAIVILALASVVGGLLWWNARLRSARDALRAAHAALAARVQALMHTYGPVAQLDERARALTQQLEKLQHDHQQATAQQHALMQRLEYEYQQRVQAQAAAQQQAAAAYLQRAEQLRAEEAQLAGRVATLRRALDALEEQADIQDAGFYRARYDFGTAAEYTARLETVREQQQKLIKTGAAVAFETKWTVDGSKRAGEKMMRDFSKLMLRAFNGECDAAVAKVRYNNVGTLEKRMRADYEAINKLSVSKHCALTPALLDLKLQELFLTFEYQDKKQREAEEQRTIREQMREEERAEREAEKARDEAEREERRVQQEADRVRAAAERASGAVRTELEAKLAALERRLAEAEAQKRKAISLAQQTRSGHVYVISNVGSFGDEIYKIGMTRRLEPQDRVDELGDASVPFPFDVHAMIYTEDAPELERRLHQRFTDRRVNRVNERKEFFRVSLDEVEHAAEELVLAIGRAAGPRGEARFTRTAKAEEWRRSAPPERVPVPVPVGPAEDHAAPEPARAMQ